MKKKKKEFEFFWESPFDNMKKIGGNLFDKPFEFKFTIPTFQQGSMNLRETKNEIIFSAELPGFKKSDISLHITESSIELNASRKKSSIEKGDKSFRREFTEKSIRKAFTLPKLVDAGSAHANLEDGILTVVMPKLRKDLKKKRRLDIK